MIFVKVLANKINFRIILKMNKAKLRLSWAELKLIEVYRDLNSKESKF